MQKTLATPASNQALFELTACEYYWTLVMSGRRQLGSVGFRRVDTSTQRTAGLWHMSTLVTSVIVRVLDMVAAVTAHAC